MSTTITFTESRIFAYGLSQFFRRTFARFYPEAKEEGCDVLVMAREPFNEEVVDDVLPSEGTPIGDVLYVCVPVMEMFPEDPKCYNPSFLTKIIHNGRQMSVDVFELALVDGKWCIGFIQEDESVLSVKVGSSIELTPMVDLAVEILGVDRDKCVTFAIFPPGSI